MVFFEVFVLINMLNMNIEEFVDWLDVNDIFIFGFEFCNDVEIIIDFRFYCGEK